MALVRPHLGFPRAGFWTNPFGAVTVFALGTLSFALGTPLGVGMILATTVVGLTYFSVGVGQIVASERSV